MANGHEYCLTEVTDPTEIGVCIGDTTSGRLSDGPMGEERICIGLPTKDIQWSEDDKPEDWGNQISFKPECILQLVRLLETIRHLWDNEETRAKLKEAEEKEFNNVLGR